MSRFIEILRNLWRETLDLLFPRRANCMGCGMMTGFENDWLCPACEKALASLWIGGRAYPGEGGVFLRAHAFVYAPPASGLIRNLKYHMVSALAESMAGPMAQTYSSLGIAGNALLVPVPMHKSRVRKRGRNHAELLARSTAARLSLPWENALKKTRATRQQALLSREARMQNLLSSYGVQTDVSGRDIVLIDDVYTTGATALTCANALLSAGAKRVFVLTYARTALRPTPSNPWAADDSAQSPKNR